MPDSRRGWTEDDIAKLRNLAGKLPAKEIAAELGRSHGATAVEASKLGLSLRTQRRSRIAKPGAENPFLTNHP